MEEAADSKDLILACYDELHRIASAMFNQERPDHTLQATALVNDAYIRLFGQSNIRFNDKAHFIRVAAKAMRQLLIDHSRRTSAKKRGGAGKPIHLPTLCPLGDGKQVDVVEVMALHEALQKLEKLNERHAEIVSLRIFAGLKIAETAEVLNVSHTSVENGWKYALAWLRKELSDQKTQNDTQ